MLKRSEHCRVTEVTVAGDDTTHTDNVSTAFWVCYYFLGSTLL